MGTGLLCEGVLGDSGGQTQPSQGPLSFNDHGCPPLELGLAQLDDLAVEVVAPDVLVVCVVERANKPAGHQQHSQVQGSASQVKHQHPAGGGCGDIQAKANRGGDWLVDELDRVHATGGYGGAHRFSAILIKRARDCYDSLGDLGPKKALCCLPHSCKHQACQLRPRVLDLLPFAVGCERRHTVCACSNLHGGVLAVIREGESVAMPPAATLGARRSTLFTAASSSSLNVLPMCHRQPSTVFLAFFAALRPAASPTSSSCSVKETAHGVVRWPCSFAITMFRSP